MKEYILNLEKGSVFIANTDIRLSIVPYCSFNYFLKKLVHSPEFEQIINEWVDIILSIYNLEPTSLSNATLEEFIKFIDNVNAEWGLGRVEGGMWNQLLWLKWKNITLDEETLIFGEVWFSSLIKKLTGEETMVTGIEKEKDHILYWILGKETSKKVKELKEGGASTLELAIKLLT